MQRSLWASAERFRETFPAAGFDSGAFARTMSRTTRQSDDAAGMIGGLLLDLMVEPPLREMRLAFAHDQLVEALGQRGSKEPEADAAEILAEIFEGAPAFGLRIMIAAARRGADVAELRRYDSVIADLHPALELAGAQPVGPQEHPVADTDQAPGNQWPGHLRTDCSPHVEHDLLVVLAGRSVGVGETLSIARALRIPVVVAVLTDTMSPSCRLDADGDLVGQAIIDVRDGDLADVITAEVEATARRARTEQRRRVTRMINSHAYRSYLAGQPLVAGLPSAARASLASPFRFIGLSRHETGRLAQELDAFEETDFRIYESLQGATRDAYDGVAAGLSRNARVCLLRSGSSSIVAQGTDRRDQRPLDWNSTSTWGRLLDKLERTR